MFLSNERYIHFPFKYQQVEKNIKIRSCNFLYLMIFLIILILKICLEENLDVTKNSNSSFLNHLYLMYFRNMFINCF